MGAKLGVGPFNRGRPAERGSGPDRLTKENLCPIIQQKRQAHARILSLHHKPYREHSLGAMLCFASYGHFLSPCLAQVLLRINSHKARFSPEATAPVPSGPAPDCHRAYAVQRSEQRDLDARAPAGVPQLSSQSEGACPLLAASTGGSKPGVSADFSDCRPSRA